MGLPDLTTVLGHLHVVRVPMRVRFRGVTERECALIEGPLGWGEVSPFLEYGPQESARWLASSLEAAWLGWPEAIRDRVPVNATVPAVSADEVPAVLARFDGTTTAKVKVAERGQTLRDDVDRVAAVRDCLGEGGTVRVDANGGWSLEEAREAIDELAPFGLEYVEQPCATVAELAALRRAVSRGGLDVPVAADESIRKAEDPLRVAREEAADLIVVKVAPLGGVRRALEIVDACGLPAVVSSALETSVGIRAGVALAAALPELPYACGLGTVGLLGGDSARTPFVPKGGELPVEQVAADREHLARWAAPAERTQWWRDRIAAMWAYLPD